MQVKSITRNVRISAFKAREVTREIQGLPATDAMSLLEFVPKKAAGLVRKTLASAIANAENNNGANPAALVIKEAVVGEGPTMKRFVPKARGSAGPIRKRTSHIRVVVTDEIPIERREDRPKKGSKKAGKPAGKRTAKKVEGVETTPAVSEPVPAEKPAASKAATSKPAEPSSEKGTES